VLYATVLGWPGSTLTLVTLKSGAINLGGLTSVHLLGSTAGTSVNLPGRTQDSSGLHLSMPSSGAPFSAPAYVVKLTFAGLIGGVATATASTTTSTTITSGGTGGCAATYRLAGSWPGGFQGEVTITNNGTAPTSGRTVKLTLASGQAIASLWSGVNSGTTGTVTIKNAAYNGVIPAGGSTTFGFTATGDGPIAPTGISCTTP